jgi:hypothetical protein
MGQQVYIRADHFSSWSKNHYACMVSVTAHVCTNLSVASNEHTSFTSRAFDLLWITRLEQPSFDRCGYVYSSPT